MDSENESEADETGEVHEEQEPIDETEMVVDPDSVEEHDWDYDDLGEGEWGFDDDRKQENDGDGADEPADDDDTDSDSGSDYDYDAMCRQEKLEHELAKALVMLPWFASMDGTFDDSSESVKYLRAWLEHADLAADMRADPTAVHVSRQLAKALRRQKNVRGAESVLKQAIRCALHICEDGDGLLMAAADLAELYADSGRVTESRRVLLRAASQRRRLLVPLPRTSRDDVTRTSALWIDSPAPEKPAISPEVIPF